MRLKDKVAIVTGASHGIGEAIIYRFVEEGAKVTLCDIDEVGLKKVVSKIADMNGECLQAVGSVTDKGFVEAMVNHTVERFKSLDIMINNAAIIRDVVLHKMTEKQWDEVIDVNLKGTFHCLQAAAIYMRGQGKGVIINISSQSRFGNPGQLNYSASKGGVVSMTRTAAKELARKNIRVNCVSPSTILTEMLKSVPENLLNVYKAFIPLGRFGDPKEVANVCLFLASEEASYITGQTINVDGGLFMV